MHAIFVSVIVFRDFDKTEPQQIKDAQVQYVYNIYVVVRQS